MNSSGLAGGGDREVDVCLGDFVDVVGPGVEGHVEHDLDDLSVAVAGELDGAQVVFAGVPALAGDPGGKADGGIGLGIVRRATTVGGDFGIVELGQVLRHIAVGGEAIVAAIDLGYREGDWYLWLDADEFKLLAAHRGYKTVVFMVTYGACYEIYGYDRDGNLVEAYFNPVNARLMRSNRVQIAR